jgi:hypothetical protein
MTLKLCKSPKHSEHQSPMWCGRVGPGIAKAAECCASLADCVESVEEIARRAREPIELAHNQRIAITKRLDCFGELWAIRCKPR